MKLKFNRFGLVSDPRGGHCTYQYQGRQILGEVVGVIRSENRGFTFLKVKYFNGEPWPIDPIAANVEMLEHDYEEPHARYDCGSTCVIHKTT